MESPPWCCQSKEEQGEAAGKKGGSWGDSEVRSGAAGVAGILVSRGGGGLGAVSPQPISAALALQPAGACPCPPHTKISTLRRGKQGEVLKPVRAWGASGVREGGLESLEPEGAGGSPWLGRGELGKEGEGTCPRSFSVTWPLGQSDQ